MNRFRFLILPAAILAGLSVGSVSTLQADEPTTPGILRISDASPVAAAQPVARNTVYVSALGGGYQGCRSTGCVGCNSGCRQRPFKLQHCGSPSWSIVGSWINCGNYCLHSPGHGWAPPCKHPVHRRGNEYQKYYPAAWYGSPNGGTAKSSRPVVYQPTDTTQLGFYGQHVPMWRPAPGRYPPAPRPSNFHDRSCRYGGTRAGCLYGGTVVSPSSEESPPPAAVPAPNDANTSAGRATQQILN